MKLNLEFVKANKNWFIGGSILLLAVILYFVFRNDDEDEVVVGGSGCPSSFTLKPTGGIQSLVSTTYTTDGVKYFKQSTAGAFGAQGSLPKREISKEEFLSACKEYQKPQTGPPQP